MKTLIVDGQVFQTTAWHRGMGKYTLSLLKAYNALPKTHHRKILILNKNLPMAWERTAVIERDMDNFEVAYLDLPYAGDGFATFEQRDESRRRLDRWIEQAVEGPADFLICSLFTFDYCSRFPARTTNYLIFYDLIPFILWSEYRHYFDVSVYLPHFGTIFEADHLLAISETVREDVTRLLGIDSERVTSINGAFIARDIYAADDAYSLPEQPYILMPTGDSPHKNNVNAVKAFEAMNELAGYRYNLIVTSFMSDDSRRKLSYYSDHIIFTGNVAESALESLYDNAEMVFFPSKIEGLGLPILEGVAKNKPIACSSIGVFEEISQQAFYSFDPDQVEHITEALIAAALKEDWDERQAEYSRIKQKYTWQNSAQTMCNLMRKPITKPKSVRSKPKVAIVMPHPGTGTRAAIQWQRNHASLAGTYEISYFLDDGGTHRNDYPAYLVYMAECHPAEAFVPELYSRFEMVLYVVDGSIFSFEAVRQASVLPGVMVITSDAVSDDSVDYAAASPASSLEKQLLRLLDVRPTLPVAALNNSIGVYVENNPSAVQAAIVSGVAAAATPKGDVIAASLKVVAAGKASGVGRDAGRIAASRSFEAVRKELESAIMKPQHHKERA